MVDVQGTSLITLHLNLDLDFEEDDPELIETVIDNLKWHLEVEKEIENIEDYKIIPTP